jgi:hypothetical protein
MSSGTCIYCKLQGKPFHREHVMPQAFGTFEPGSPVLSDCVCADCNNYFGRTLELALSRDSVEALLRLRYGVKPASKANQLPYKKLELKVGEPGPWLGATVVLEADSTGKGIEPIPVPQVAFKWKSESEWAWLLEKEMDANRLASYVGAPTGTLDIRVCGPSPVDHARLVEKLKQSGIKFVQQGKLAQPLAADGTVQIEIAAQVDATIFRAIAKIAFNYVAYVHGAAFALRSDFDDLRNYIRYGTAPAWAPVVKPFKNPILANDLPQMRQTNGHLITFNWNIEQMGLLAQVSLFNSVTYHVLFCPKYSGIWSEDMRTGHHFDIESRTVSPLTSISLFPFALKAARA